VGGNVHRNNAIRIFLVLLIVFFTSSFAYNTVWVHGVQSRTVIAPKNIVFLQDYDLNFSPVSFRNQSREIVIYGQGPRISWAFNLTTPFRNETAIGFIYIVPYSSTSDVGLQKIEVRSSDNTTYEQINVPPADILSSLKDRRFLLQRHT